MAHFFFFSSNWEEAANIAFNILISVSKLQTTNILWKWVEVEQGGWTLQFQELVAIGYIDKAKIYLMPNKECNSLQVAHKYLLLSNRNKIGKKRQKKNRNNLDTTLKVQYYRYSKLTIHWLDTTLYSRPSSIISEKPGRRGKGWQIVIFTLYALGFLERLKFSCLAANDHMCEEGRGES